MSKMNESTGTARIYPSAPLEEVVVNNGNEQRQTLLPPSPPSYDQATSGESPIPTPRMTTTGPSVVVITNPVAAPFGPRPQDMQCPYCHNYTRTRLRNRPTSRTHIIALILCLFQLYCCVCLPYCIASCMQTNHYCGMCDHYLGTYHRA